MTVIDVALMASTLIILEVIVLGIASAGEMLLPVYI